MDGKHNTNQNVIVNIKVYVIFLSYENWVSITLSNLWIYKMFRKPFKHCTVGQRQDKSIFGGLNVNGFYCPIYEFARNEKI